VDDSIRQVVRELNHTEEVFKTMENPSAATQADVAKAKTDLTPLVEQYNQIKGQMKFFGFTSADAGTANFFSIWLKFVESFGIALTYNLNLAEKEAQAKQAKIEKERKMLTENLLAEVKPLTMRGPSSSAPKVFEVSHRKC